jgi:1-deoxy-D-xylulose-5-phosphate synthase
VSRLATIDHPSQLRSLPLSALDELAAEIRERIISVLSVNGGHLSSNLGIVELTIALHTAFDSPTDKLIFDVSHQTYPHKLLTGRNSRFDTIRQYQGLCGFAHPKESAHDHFFAGHAGTALSLALGMLKRRDLIGESGYVVPILGDASLTCGLTLEALNNVPALGKRFIAVLNDNDRSISENVGNIKQLFRNGAQAPFFQQFGFTYLGPIDGHQIPQLLDALSYAKTLPGPVLLHVLTTKGKGMPIAIANPTPYHGVRPFDLCSGKILPSPSSKPTFPKIFGKTLLEMASRDPTIVCVSPAMTAGSCLDELFAKYPERCFDVGIAEGHAVTFAGGLASGKQLKVVCSIYATFLQRALDNLFQDVCMQEAPVLFALDRSFISGPDGSTHHGIYDIAFLNAMPKMVIAQPRDGHLLKELLASAFDWERTVAIRYPNLETEERDAPIKKRTLGRGELLAPGSDVALFALGHTVSTAWEIREKLARQGIEAAIVDPIFVKPLDAELIAEMLSIAKVAVTLEEHAVLSGFGSIFNSFALQQGFSAIPILNFGIPDVWVQFGKNSQLMRELELDADSIAARIAQEVVSSHDHRSLPQREKKRLVSPRR